ncbi:alkaline phosphatase family protein [Haloterrigena sp. SYSU A121-1]|uniref:Alkaline phosphatase family protein n=1 Tax=Haloterrigena gelatinilytica TaxID=2741724 RepID=A0A8J8GNW7_9EURY|nr:alkaline phosphatase family protein [Haloterrigena gelatinilytica]NUB93226.1 alkaline phosphatase family protein [Haloterrigena gelatinilytica]
MTETIVLGLDGANWKLLEPWLESGDLPNIAALREDGVWSDMESCLPPVTCPNWRCYSTGKNPGKLGVYWWEKIDTDARTLSTPTSRSFKSSNYWDYLNEAGKSVGIMNLPMTYPPFEIDGWMVAGGPGSEQESYTYPESLEDELEVRDYRLHPEVPVTSNEERDAAAALIDLIDQRFEAFRLLLNDRPVDVAHLTVFYINVLQHFFWRDDVTKQAWTVIDEHIGEIREEYPDATLYLMSDHGCTDIDTMFYANSWLEREGYLVTETDASDTFSKFGINKKRVSSLAHRFGVHGLVTSLTPEFVKDSVPEDEEGFKREQKLEKVDWEQSSAIASGQGLIYLIDESREEELLSDLKRLERNGRPVASEVYTRDEAYEGEYVDEAPEIVFDQREGVHTSGAIGDNPLFSGAGKWKAENVRTGLFLAAGIDAGDESIEDMSITDVAPTVLHQLGVAVPSDMDGNPQLVGSRDVTPRKPISFESIDSQAADEVADRLEDLGYLE